MKMKKLYKAAYSDETRIMFILADNLYEAISMANERESHGDDGCDYFYFDSETVSEIDLASPKSQIIEDFQFELL